MDPFGQTKKLEMTSYSRLGPMQRMIWRFRIHIKIAILLQRERHRARLARKEVSRITGIQTNRIRKYEFAIVSPPCCDVFSLLSVYQASPNARQFLSELPLTGFGKITEKPIKRNSFVRHCESSSSVRRRANTPPVAKPACSPPRRPST